MLTWTAEDYELAADFPRLLAMFDGDLDTAREYIVRASRSGDERGTRPLAVLAMFTALYSCGFTGQCGAEEYRPDVCACVLAAGVHAAREKGVLGW